MSAAPLPASLTGGAEGGGAAAPQPPQASTTQQLPLTFGATDPIGAASLGAVLASLQQLTIVLQKLVAALGGTGTPAGTTDASSAPGAISNPLRGFNITGDPAEQAILSASLAKVEVTSVGASLLSNVRNHGVMLDIMPDAEFDAATGGGARDAVAVFNKGSNTILIRASQAAGDGTALTAALTHELVHAAQLASGETNDVQAYATAAGAGTATMSAAQLAAGHAVMMEAGAEYVASAIGAQIKDPTIFAAMAADPERLARNMASQQAALYATASAAAAYNPDGYQLLAGLSPTARAIFDAGLATR